MSTVNKVILIGHTGDDVKMHHFENGGCIGNISIATNESYTNKNTNEKVTTTEWHRCVLRNKTAEIAEKWLKKGDKVYFEGSLKTRKWQDGDGKDRYSTEISVNIMKFLSEKKEGAAASTATPTEDKKTDTFITQDGAPDDLPF